MLLTKIFVENELNYFKFQIFSYSITTIEVNYVQYILKIL